MLLHLKNDNNREIYLTKDKEGVLRSNLSGEWIVETSKYVHEAYRLGLRRNRDSAIEAAIQNNMNAYIIEMTQTVVNEDGVEVDLAQVNLVETATKVSQQLLDFFSEFMFEVNFRFINTLAKNSNDIQSARNYIFDYFNLINHADKFAIREKLKSDEFTSIVEQLQLFISSPTINTRFELYYGSQGTGKTTQAIEKASTLMVCHSAMLPQDLMEDFKFEEGKPTFVPSAMQIAMTEGHTIVLDEINLLPFESLRFLQSLLDNKQFFEYKADTIDIHENFKIIGTMNLVVNGATYSLPEPLVDRASALKEYRLSASQLAGALI